MDRRSLKRKTDAVPVTIRRSKGDRFGVTRNVGPGGLLLNTPSCLEPGEEVDVTLHELRGSVQRRAVVVRRDKASFDDPWRYRVALAFAS
ncbi:MAG: PilZ domain-containing protein [Polyangiaceae bacterium]|nr:PilZ domain-containing protein [Polyangiaceae bacterium]